MADKTSRLFSGKISIYATAGVLIAAALLAGSYAWIPRITPAQPGGALESVTIAQVVYPGSCPVVVAQAKGYFASEGILVTTKLYPSGKAALDAVFRGQVHLAASGNIPIMFAAMSGQPLSIVATLATAKNDFGVVGRKDRGIATPASLKGKRIGVTLGTGGHFFLDAFLTRQKLSASEVKMRDLKPDEFGDALAEGDIDAAATWQPNVGALQTQLGSNGTVFLSTGIYDENLDLAATRDYVSAHPETIKKVMRALIQAGRFCKDAPDAAREIVAEAFKIDAAGLKEVWPEYRFNITLDQSLLLALEDASRWAIRNKLTNRTDLPNYLNYVYLDALQAVSPAAVTVIH